jgi:hypothetical protein
MNRTTGDPPSGEQLFGPPPAGQAKKLTAPELSGIRRRLMLKRETADDLGPMVEGPEACRKLWESWRGLLHIEKRTYVLDVAALLEDRHRLLEELAAHHRIATATEALFHESRVSEQGQRLSSAVKRALAMAGYDTRPHLTDAGTDAPP